MASYYIYLISSLPSLHFGSKPPISFVGFLKACEGLISDWDMELIRSIGNLGLESAKAKNTTLKKWLGFETMLRNELVMIRSVRKKIDPAKYLREGPLPESDYAAHIAINASRKPSLLDAERALDLDRWRQLDELAIGHYFDMDTLVIYACKLLMLERWDKIQSAENKKMLEEALN